MVLRSVALARNGRATAALVVAASVSAATAQLYFPGLTPDGAWHKLRAWLHLNPRLSHFYELRRRTFTPAEVQLIYTELGEP